MTERNLQIIKVGLFTVATLFVGFLLYIFLFRKVPVITPAPSAPEAVIPSLGGLNISDTSGEREVAPDVDVTQPGLIGSPIADGGLVFTSQLTSSRIVAPTLTAGKKITYYDPNDGMFYTIDKNGTATLLSDAKFVGATSVTISELGDTAAIEFPDGSNIIFNFNTGLQTTLPSHWEDFHFSKDGKVAGKNIGLDSNNRSLVITNNDGSQATSIANLGDNADEVTINWSPDNSIVAFSETGSAQSAFGRQEIFLIDQSGNATGTLIVEGSNFSAAWSPSGSHIIYSIADTSRNERPALWYVKASGNEIGAERKNLNLETWVEKCTFKDEAFIICAVPKEVVDNSGFDHRFITSGDNLYQINLSTGRSSFLAAPVIETQMHNLKVSSDQTILYYTDEFGRLNTIRLR